MEVTEVEGCTRRREQEVMGVQGAALAWVGQATGVGWAERTEADAAGVAAGVGGKEALEGEATDLAAAVMRCMERPTRAPHSLSM